MKPQYIPVVGDIWESRTRKGYSVEILKVSWNMRQWGQRIREVEYRTFETPAKRPNLIPAIATIPDFQKAFRRRDRTLEGL